MTASEIAFLAFGLFLGATGGAAAATAARARGRSPREVRVTIAPAARMSRPATLATYLDPADVLPARGGPADPVELGIAGNTGSQPARDFGGRIARDAPRPSSDLDGEAVPAAAPAAPRTADRRPRIRTGVLDPGSMGGSPAGGAVSATGWVPIRVEVGRDPLLGRLLEPGDGRPGRPADGSAAAQTSPRPAPIEAAGDHRRQPKEAEMAAVAAQRHRLPLPELLPDGGSPRPTPTAAGASPFQAAAIGAPRPLAAVRADPNPQKDPGQAPQAGSSHRAPPSVSDDADPSGLDPCSGPRLLARERCEVAARAKEEAAAAAERLRAAHRAYDDAVAKAEAAAARADPRAVRAAKEAAQDAFRRARASARRRADAEAAARSWLDEINRINRDAAAATREAARHAQAVAELGPLVERLTTEADAAPIAAESAEEACFAARQALAECEEMAAAIDRAGHGPLGEAGEQPASTSGWRPVPDSAGPPPTPALAFQDDAAALVAERDREAAILRLLRGDHAVLERLVARLAGPDADEACRWRLLLADLVDAILARAIEANALDFPEDDPFWGRFTPAQCRDVAAALASLGYRFDGLGGFVDGRVPSQRDLSLAVGYAGLDPMRIRAWPTEAELSALFSRVTIAADEFLTREAGGLTLSELVELLGHRADELADVWNAWGRLRPLLIELV